jgi:hypothetical protein
MSIFSLSFVDGAAQESSSQRWVCTGPDTKLGFYRRSRPVREFLVHLVAFGRPVTKLLGAHRREPLGRQCALGLEHRSGLGDADRW